MSLQLPILATQASLDANPLPDGLLGVATDTGNVYLGRAGANISIGGGTVASLAAAGNSQGTAAAVTNRVTTVTASDGTKGVILPANVIGRRYSVYNSVATSGLPVYPPSSGTINGGTANAAVTIEGKTLAEFVVLTSTNIAATFTADS